MEKYQLFSEDVLSSLRDKIDISDIFPNGLDYLYFENIDSTNKYAKENSDNIDNAIIVAEDQYAGVGKNSSEWKAEPYKSIITTLVLSVDMDIRQVSILPLFIGAVIHDVLEMYGIKSSIKWPNDIYLDNKKLTGILCESIIKNSRVKKLIIGIGINVNQTEEELSNDRMISLNSYTGHEFDRRDLLADILALVFEKWSNYDEIEDYAKRTVNKNLYLKGEDITFIADKEIKGKLVGINNKGGVIILTDEGVKEFTSGKILV